ncbi:MurR/RpiR family transcriptional regulator [Sphingopyxis sp. JAI128]|uniref:MurR/RpiR family transcriptional regulator n=1 Tax=Sphingopyxis sp. JAI128 TaxID=2723066 RepID=UPI001620AA4A|nr:MurR/RpiR family transcriptional regulator [Sphingopyxis sp. JAI128]MBB6428153.1 DNA-binding MurR/RpiR family transcriptional regulator [Sphingopyxis sp. JAI128]
MNKQADTSRDLLQRLEDNLESFTASERSIANFILMNRGGIAFETAHSIAEKLQVSSITVGRFARKMGYKHFKDLKTGLRMTMSGVPWLVGDQVTDFIGSHGESDRSKRSLELELAGIIEVYAMAETDSWKEIVALLAHSKHVHVAGFQTERGVAATLANLLQYAREGVSIVDSSAGHYNDLFSVNPRGHCLVLVEFRRYSDQAFALAEQAQREGIPIIMITDKFCDWIRKFTDHVIAVPTEVDLFWSSQVSLSCAVNLLINDVIGALGKKVEQRLERLSALYQAHVGHVGSPARKRSGRT